ncbi:hypothetical protein AWB74_07870 [Caballeronia arvi]|uniref:Uncharacterized protein n=1 Tax=Caballeronia arvi TaxID=1777135 RepID=A0A158L0F2_9BURK|nr:hypothetical protein AWB74_07870 [Caballeronia arvi]
MPLSELGLYPASHAGEPYFRQRILVAKSRPALTGPSLRQAFAVSPSMFYCSVASPSNAR